MKLRTLTVAMALANATATFMPATALAAPGQVYVNLFEWKYDDIAQECRQFLKPAGFTAVQISVPTESKSNSNQWWERYQPVSYKLTSRSGTREQLAAMVNTCRDQGIAIYADVVLNHLANGSGTGMAGSPYSEARSYVMPFTGDDFHHRCGIDDSNAFSVHDCWLGGDLPDLRTDRANVRDAQRAFLNDLISLGVAGFRVDAAKHVPAADLQETLGKTAALRSDIAALTNRTRPWVTHEVSGGFGTINEAERSQYFNLGTVNEFKYKDILRDAFKGENGLSLAQLYDTIPINDARPNPRGLFASRNATVFVSNHDTERHSGQSLNVSNGKIFNLANIFMLAYPYGQPQLQSGFRLSYPTDKGGASPNDQLVPSGRIYDASGNADFTGWDQQHRWPEIANMVEFRNRTQSAWQVDDWVSSGPGRIAFHRGNLGFLAINRSDNDAWIGTFKTGLPPGQYCNILRGKLNAAGTGCTGEVVTVAADSTATLSIPPLSQAGMPAVALHAGQKITQDTTPPLCNCLIHVDEVTETSVRLSWQPAVDNESGIALYEVFRNGILIATTHIPSITVTGLQPATGYTFSVRAVNGAGLRCPMSVSIMVTTKPAACTVPVTFQVKDQTTVFGQDVYLTGSGNELGNWTTATPIPLSATAWPLWTVTRNLPAGRTFEYKYIKKGVKPLQWETGSNRSVVVPACGSSGVVIPLTNFRQ